MKSRALAVVLIAGALRLGVAAATPLFPDETYYWDWSRHLQTGYFDHPPLVAFLVKLGTLIFGATPIGVRLGPVLVGIVASLLVMFTARRISGERAALVAAIVFAAMPLTAAGLILATPDAGLMAATAGVIYCVVRALEHPARSRQSLTWWCIAGVAQGIAFWAKYTAILVPAGLALALIVFPEHRSRLREAGPYVATLIASIVFAPVLVWNANHGWASFAFQLQHGLSGGGGSILQREGELIGGQMGLVTPVLFVMMALCVASVLRSSTRRDVGRMLATISVLVFVFFAYSATKRRVEANWPALAYLPATLLLSARIASPRWSRWLIGGTGLAAALSLVTYVNSLVPILPVKASRDPAARAAGWQDLAAVVSVTRDSLGAQRTYVAGNRYQEASEMAFHLADHPPALSLNVDARPNHYDLWPGFEKRATQGDNLILVVDDLGGDIIHPAAKALAPHFATLLPATSVALTRNGDPVKYLKLWKLTGWRGTWPASPIRSAP